MYSFRALAAATTGLMVLPHTAAWAQANVAASDGPGAERTKVGEVILVADNLFESERGDSIIAEGNVEATYEGRILQADRLIYNRATDQVRAIGNVVIIDEDGTQRFAEEVEVDSTLDEGYAVGFSMRMENGARAVASSAVRQDGGLNALDQVVYTACEICEDGDRPTWALRARRAVLDQESQMISYRDAVLEIAGVPVIYLPYFAHPDPNSGRRSGFLFPDFGLSSTVGAFYQQPYYWAISDHQELTIAPEVYQRVNPLLELDYSKQFWSGRLNIQTSITQEALFDGDGERLESSDSSVRSHIFADGYFSLNRRWNWGFGVERVTDDLYLDRYNIDGENDLRGLYASVPKRLLTQLFLTGQDSTFYSETSLLSFQGLRAGDENSRIPTVSPLSFHERTFDMGGWGLSAVNASTAILSREDGADSHRVSVGGDWSHRIVLPGGVLMAPFADARVDYYGLDEEVSGESSVTRGVGSVGTTLSYPLIRRGERVDITVEPIVMGAIGVTGANDEPIPNEDTLLSEFTVTSLFDPNGVNGYDLYEGDGRVSAGLSTTMRWKNGVELQAVGGKRWRSREDEAFSTFSNLGGEESDWLAGASLDLGRTLRLETDLRLDQDSLELNRIDARLSSQVWRVGGSVQYFNISDEIAPLNRADEGISIQGTFRLTDNLSLVYARLRDIELGLDQTHGVGVRYTDGCSIFEIVYERSDSRDRELGPSESLRFAFTLRSLGQFGSSDVD